MPPRAPGLLLVVLIAGLAVASIAAQAPAAADGRLRSNGGPAPHPVVGDSSGRALAASGERIPVRRSTVAAGGSPSWHVAGSRGRGNGTTRSPLVPASDSHFDALSGSQHDPADPTGAVGARNILTAVNTQVAVYDRAGNQRVGPVSLGTLATGTPGQKFDPKIVYDHYAHTFVLTFLIRYPARRRSWIFVTTIPDDTANDQSTWCAAKLRGDAFGGNGRQWADYPAVGYDQDSVTIATNAFDFGGGRFAYAQLYHVTNDVLFASGCDNTVVFTKFGGAATRDPSGNKAFTIQPAQTEGTASTQYLLSYDPSGAIVVWRLRDTSNGATLTRAAVDVRRAHVAPYGTQRGGSYRDPDTWWDPGDLRLVNAFYDAELHSVYAAHVIYHDLRPDRIVPYAESTIRWYELRPARRLRASSVTRTGLVGRSETDAGWPVVATDDAGNLFVTYSRASKPRGEYLSAWAAEIAPGSTAATTHLLRPGTSRFEALAGEVERWGDFNAINRDPVDGAFVAMIDQYAKDDGRAPAGSTDLWQQTFDLVSDG